jgi:MFS family permease
MTVRFGKDLQYYKFCLYGFLKNQRFFEPFLILIFLRDKGLNFTEIGTLYSIRFILQFFFEVPSGVAADAMGRRGTLLFAYGFYMVSFAGYFMAKTFAWLIIPSIFFALGDAFRTGTHKAMIFEYLKRNGWQDQKVDYYGHTRAWSQTGSAISSLIAAGLVFLSKNFNVVFLYTLVPYTLGFVLLASYPRYLNGQATFRSGKKHLLKDFGEVIRTSVQSLKQFANLKLALNVATFSGFYDAAKDYLQVVLSTFALALPVMVSVKRSDNEKEIILIGIVYFILYFLTAGASRNTYRMNTLFRSTDRYLNIFLLLGIFCGLGAGIFFHYRMFVPSVILFILILVIENLRRPAGIALIAGYFNENILASILSVESQLGSIVSSVLSILIGWFADRFGPGLALTLASIVLLLFSPMLILKKNYEKISY